MSEIEALKVIDDAMSGLSEEERARVLLWANSKYGIQRPGDPRIPSAVNSTESAALDNELPGIAYLTENGEMKLTVRNLKASSTNDAAIRLAHIVILSYEKLTGEKSVSSKKILTPILKEWRAYSGNTRPLLAKHKGIIRNGDMLSLDAHSRREAEQYIHEILDPEVDRDWTPKNRTRKK